MGSVTTLFIAAALHIGSVMPAYSDARCKTLEEMNRQWAGVALTVQQKAVKRALVQWYRRNCQGAGR